MSQGFSIIPTDRTNNNYNASIEFVGLRRTHYLVEIHRRMVRCIDAWCQPSFADFSDKLPEIERLFTQSKTPFLGKSVGPDEMVKLMDKAGVDHSLLSAWHRPNRILISNEDVAQFTKAYPDRFSGVATVNLEDPVAAVRELERAVKEYGFKAVRVLPWLWKKPPTDPLYYPLYVKCVELDIPFCTQVGHTGPLMPSEVGRPIPYIDEIALTFPQLKIIGGHIGYPWTDEMISLCWKHENVYLDTSAYAPRFYPPQLVHYMSTYGKTKVLFGTNFPMLTFSQCTAQLGELNLPADAMEHFLHLNAERLFKIPSAKTPARL